MVESVRGERPDVKSLRIGWVAPFQISADGKGSEVRDGVAGFTDNGDRVIKTGDIGYSVVEVRHGEIMGGVTM